MTDAAPPTPHCERLTWPSSRCYFALLDASRVPGGERVSEERLRFILEPELPEPLEDVHAAFLRVSATQWIACAVPRRAIEAEVAASVVSLTPDAIPKQLLDAVAAIEGSIAPSDFELLIGDYEPKTIRAWRRRCITGAITVVVVVLAIALIGVERRIRQAIGHAEKLRAQRFELVAKALGEAGAAASLPPELRLVAALRALRQTRRQGDAIAPARDATDVLEQLLRSWPESLPTRTDSVVISETAVHVRGIVADSDAAQSLASATAPLAGFEAAFPAVQSAPDGWRFGLAWQRKSTATGGQQP